MDRILAVLLALWALLGLLPVGAWTGVTGTPYYLEAWGLWSRALGIVVLATALVLFLGGPGAARAVRRRLNTIVALPLPTFLAVLGATAALEAAAVAFWCFGRMPPLIDVWVQYFQARVLLSGSWIAPAPASPAHFGILFAPITERGWFGQYPPIHPALLAAGLAAGVPWLVTPMLAAALPAAVYALGAETGDQRVGRLAAALVLLSPFVIAIDASAMNHLPAALAVATGLAALPQVARGSWGAGLVLGAAVGLVLGLRPLDGVILAAVAGVAVLVGLRSRGAVAMLACLVLTGLATLAPTLAYNRATTGSFTTFTYAVVQGTLLGLDQDVPWGTTLTALRALGLTAIDAHQMNVYLLEWPVPVTVLAALGAWYGGRRTRAASAYLVLLVGALFLYFHRDTLFGPRLLFSAVPALLVLVAVGVMRLTDATMTLGRLDTTLGDAVVVGLTIMAVLSAATMVPHRLASHRTVGTPIALHPEEDAHDAGIDRALVFIPDGLGSRLIVRMWAGGVPMTASTHLYKRADACRLADALATVEAGGAGADFQTRLEHELTGSTPGRRIAGAAPDPMLRLPDDGRVSPRCAAELARDRRGMLQFAPYLYLNAPRLDGPIVWARELGEPDVELARRYPDRPVYRYRGPQRDGASPFLRLSDRGDTWTGAAE